MKRPIKLFGAYFAFNIFGNCFAPAIHIDPPMGKSFMGKQGNKCYPSKIHVTLRSSNRLETCIYWRGWFKFDWNSNHIARWFGKSKEESFGDIWVYNGILGNHIDV